MTTPKEAVSPRTAELAGFLIARHRTVQPLAGLPVPFNDVFVAHVGDQATKVWAVLLGVRDSQGTTHVTIGGIQRLVADLPWQQPSHGQLSQPQIRRAVARLKVLRLVLDIGWEHSLSKDGDAMRELYRRKVVGNIRRRKDAVEVLLPDDARGQVNMATTHGGKRAGAGRPKRIQVVGGAARLENPDDTSSDIQVVEGSPRLENQPDQAGRGRESKRAAKGREVVEQEDVVAFLPSEEKPAAAPRFLFSGEAEADTSMHDVGLLRCHDDGDRGLVGGGAARTYSPDEWGLLPPFPGVATLRPAVVPPPPMVAQSATDEERVTMLLTAYNLALAHQLPRVFNKHANTSKPLKAAERKLLVDASHALYEHNVSPLRWVEFSLSTFAASAEAAAKKKGREPGAPRCPPLAFVFTVDRINTKAGWARRAFDRRGGNFVLTRSARIIVSKWTAMMSAVLRGEVSPRDAGAKFFPEGQYERLVEKAVAEAQREQARIDTDIAAGKYLW